ncbi:hypothetical protein P389DRAFT_177647 [Cystobasidium minutum MCA 4210]|uniref:uncharacterized protein n=1 Tax=Cystobasidium minutum MCA 4210 TaxID=1397322 RepID=UPI0034CE9803|eukprot:jgi/Rhomi1/177647/fgenesh1_pg.2_\
MDFYGLNHPAIWNGCQPVHFWCRLDDSKRDDELTELDRNYFTHTWPANRSKDLLNIFTIECSMAGTPNARLKLNDKDANLHATKAVYDVLLDFVRYRYFPRSGVELFSMSKVSRKPIGMSFGKGEPGEDISLRCTIKESQSDRQQYRSKLARFVEAPLRAVGKGKLDLLDIFEIEYLSSSEQPQRARKLFADAQRRPELRASSSVLNKLADLAWHRLLYSDSRSRELHCIGYVFEADASFQVFSLMNPVCTRETTSLKRRGLPMSPPELENGRSRSIGSGRNSIFGLTSQNGSQNSLLTRLLRRSSRSSIYSDASANDSRTSFWSQTSRGTSASSMRSRSRLPLKSIATEVISATHWRGRGDPLEDT